MINQINQVPNQMTNITLFSQIDKNTNGKIEPAEMRAYGFFNNMKLAQFKAMVGSEMGAECGQVWSDIEQREKYGEAKR